MRKKLALLLFALATVWLTGIAGPAASAQTSNVCPKGSHLIVCPEPDDSFCCPNNAFCVCGDID